MLLNAIKFFLIFCVLSRDHGERQVVALALENSLSMLHVMGLLFGFGTLMVVTFFRPQLLKYKNPFNTEGFKCINNVLCDIVSRLGLFGAYLRMTFENACYH